MVTSQRFHVGPRDLVRGWRRARGLFPIGDVVFQGFDSYRGDFPGNAVLGFEEGFESGRDVFFCLNLLDEKRMNLALVLGDPSSQRTLLWMTAKYGLGVKTGRLGEEDRGSLARSG